MNTVTSHLSYLFRCNTDVTSLWSGTALKAVIIYISEYITKSALKTHVMFDAIKSVFDKNTSLISGSLPDSEKARILMNKMVNLLSTKSEMGGPMVCMYLLGQPDHYASHQFVPFYWKTFVNEAKKSWLPETEKDTTEKISIIKIKNKIVGFSPVYDYIYRSHELESLCVYDWIKLCVRKKFNSTFLKRKHNESSSTESDSSDQSKKSDSSNKLNPNINVSKAKQIPKNLHLFLTKHPLHESHASHLSQDDDKTVVNFIGGLLPRRNEEDDEYYQTMLALFKPWRSGCNLRNNEMSWADTFNGHKFSPKHEKLMKNFNIRYECMDARDDFRAQRKSQSDFACFWNNEMSDDYSFESNEANDEESAEMNVTSAQMFMEVGPKEARLKTERLQMKNVLNQVGWLDPLPSAMLIDSNLLESPPLSLTSLQWKTLVLQKKAEVIENRQQNQIVGNASSDNFFHMKPAIKDTVKIVDKSYLQKKYHTFYSNTSIEGISAEYHLNAEQERAFKMIAYHSIYESNEQLLMYIGGMAGTGKTQVIKALSSFFSQRNEGYRLISVAPTGTAAALLAGSTYHSVFGIHDQVNEAPGKMLSQVRLRLNGVDYIFLDEVSMLSCHDLYKISSQLAKVQNQPDKPFGGLNVIFAGDFAQLPPPIGGENVALYSRTVGKYTNSVRQQEEAMGLAIWHQVTNVVILRENMWQQGLKADDDKLREAVQNMRYKDCTANDIQFLKSHATSSLPEKPNICDDAFRNISIITAKNSQKDEINRLGCIQFAQETNQELTHFYSEDSPKAHVSSKNSKQNKKSFHLKEISNDLQQILWNLPHSCADRPAAGKLSLCLNMPVIIKCNVATELCITNGQEGTVAWWTSSTGAKGQKILETLFVHLTNPPTDVSFDGLPINVIPLCRTNNAIVCKLPDDSKVSINRSQVEVLPNFAMTDYASQGKTRAYNVVDLINCRSHQAYYTALSRSASACGTIILHGFNANKITGRASQGLRQEFRDLEFLDEIGKLKYNDKLPEQIIGNTRSALITAYRNYRGLSYIPPLLHKSLKWSKDDPFLEPPNSFVKWKILKKNKIKVTSTTTPNEKAESNNDTTADSNLAFSAIHNHTSDKKNTGNESLNKAEFMQLDAIPEVLNNENNTQLHSNAATDIVPINDMPELEDPNLETIYNIGDKRKLDSDNEYHLGKHPKKSHDYSSHEKSSVKFVPSGFAWHMNSCAYDSVLSIFHAIWHGEKRNGPHPISLQPYNILLSSVLNDFELAEKGSIPLNTCRDNLRVRLSDLYPDIFPWGGFAGVHDLLSYMLETQNHTFVSTLHCIHDDHVQGHICTNITNFFMRVNSRTYTSLEGWVNNIRETTRHGCPSCGKRHFMKTTIEYPIPILALEFTDIKLEIN